MSAEPGPDAASVITSLERAPRRKRLTVHFERQPPISVTPDIATRFGLHPGVSLTEARRDEVLEAQAREDAISSALRLVAYQPRSEKQLRERLGRRGVAERVIDRTIARLKELRLIDDTAFAAAWVEVRDRASPRSRRLLAAELREKGVAGPVALSSASAVDDAAAAYRAGLKRARRLAGKPFPEFQRKVGDLLLRRGFDYETAGEAVRRLFEECATPASGESPGP
jgi:regulatory protein